MAEAGSTGLVSFCSYFPSYFSLETFSHPSQGPLVGQEQDSSTQ